MIRRAIAIAIVLGSITSGAARAADANVPKANSADASVLKAIPADAQGFLLINHLDKTSDKLMKVGQLAQQQVPPLLMLAKQQFGFQEGFDDSGTVAVVVMPGAADDSPPNVLILVPVTDFKKFAAQLNPDKPDAPISKVALMGAPTLLAKKGNFAVLAPDTGSDAGMKDFLAAKSDVSIAVKPLQKRLFANDISLALTPSGLARVFDVMKAGMEQGRAAAAMSGQSPEATASMFEMIDEALDACQKEVSHFALGIHIDDDGNMDIGTWSIFVPAGDFTKAAKDAVAPDADLIEGLPADPFYLAGGGVLPQSWAELLAKMSVRMMKLNPVMMQMSDEQTQKLTEINEQLQKGMHSIAALMGAPEKGQTHYDNMLTVARVDDAAKYVADFKKSFELVAESNDGAGKSIYAIKDTKIGDLSAVEITVDMLEMFKDQPNADASIEMTKKMFGPSGKMILYVAAINPKTIAQVYMKPENITRLAKSVKASSGKAGSSGLAGDPQVKIATDLLPTGGQWTGYLSVDGLVRYVRSMLETALPPGAPKIKVPDFPESPPIGATAKMLPFGMETHIVVPAPLVTAIGKYIPQVQAAVAGAMQ